MDNKQAIELLNNILITLPVTSEQKSGLEYAISKLKKSNTKETLIDVAKILADLLGAGSKFLDP